MFQQHLLLDNKQLIAKAWTMRMANLLNLDQRLLLAILLLLCILDSADWLVSLSIPISIWQRPLFASSSNMNMNTNNNPLLDVWTEEARKDIAMDRTGRTD
jgi:hypothetical protein